MIAFTRVLSTRVDTHGVAPAGVTICLRPPWWRRLTRICTVMVRPSLLMVSRPASTREARRERGADVIAQRFGFLFYLFDAVLDHVANRLSGIISVRHWRSPGATERRPPR